MFIATCGNNWRICNCACTLCELAMHALKLSMKFLPSPLTTYVVYLIFLHLIC